MEFYEIAKAARESKEMAIEEVAILLKVPARRIELFESNEFPIGIPAMESELKKILEIKIGGMNSCLIIKQ